MDEISAADALLLAQADAVLLDVRESFEWDRGHSPIALNIPMSELNARVGELPDDRQILVVCHSGSRSHRVAVALRERGYDATNIIGGMVAWEQAGGALVAEGSELPRVD